MLLGSPACGSSVVGSVYEQALAEGLPDVLVSVLDLDATERLASEACPTPCWCERLDQHTGVGHRPALSDPEGQWRPVSGDARWRVETWRQPLDALSERNGTQRVASYRARASVTAPRWSVAQASPERAPASPFPESVVPS